MKTTIFKHGGAAALKKIASTAAAVCVLMAGAVFFPSIEASAEDGIGIVTTIPNVETSVPQQTQELQDPEEQVQEQQDDELPYEEPVTDDDLDAESLLDLLDINNSSNTIDLIILITILSVAPSILVMLTCFTRIVISFSLLRNAMGVQQSPPNQVMIGLALFLTLFIMSPVISEMNEVAYVPYKNGEYTSVEAIQEASVPLKKWMLKNTSNESMNFFLELSGSEASIENEEEFLEEVSFTTVVPAFILSEIKIGFEIGFLLYIPFLIVDIVVSTVLMSMGMMMLPPTTISIPFKILLFILADGWTLLVGSLVNGFNT
ncbi:MAG: flagellar type III secretion system pore protein FliP [Oscillospiraceae bacterium]|nr:flagellar type III secretion system pore protein FliP [Oscillospiraceae bacterium]